MKQLRTILLCVLCGCTSAAKKTLQATGAVAETTLKVGGKVTKAAVVSTIDIAGAAFKKGVVTVRSKGGRIYKKRHPINRVRLYKGKN